MAADNMLPFPREPQDDAERDAVHGEGGRCCPALTDGGRYGCTRTEGHVGDHIAGGGAIRPRKVEEG